MTTDHTADLEAQIAELQARVAELEVALQPWVTVGSAWLTSSPQDESAVFRPPAGAGFPRTMKVTIGDLRRAVRALPTARSLPISRPKDGPVYPTIRQSAE